MADPAAVRSLEELAAEHVRAFHERYGKRSEPPRLFFSPGRVNLFGGHLDYNGGPVMPTAIDRGTLVAARRRRDDRLLLATTHDARDFEFDLDEAPLERLGQWVDYPLGVIVDLLARERERGPAAGTCGLEVLFGGNLPVGAGLSSSASVCVGTAFALDHLWGLGLGPGERVASALRAERSFVGVQCGIMDPYAVGYARPGHVLWLDCKDRSFEHLPIDLERLAVLVADTGIKRELAAGEFNLRVEQCRAAFEALAPHAPGAEVLRDIPAAVLEAHGHQLDPVLLRRARHVVDEVARTFGARAALLQGDVAALGRTMTAAHVSLRDLYEVSCPELDALVEAAAETPGALGARLTGAGFGGCVVALIERDAAASVTAALQASFRARFGREPAVEVFGGDEGPRELG